MHLTRLFQNVWLYYFKYQLLTFFFFFFQQFFENKSSKDHKEFLVSIPYNNIYIIYKSDTMHDNLCFYSQRSFSSYFDEENLLKNFYQSTQYICCFNQYYYYICVFFFVFFFCQLVLFSVLLKRKPASDYVRNNFHVFSTISMSNKI